MTAVATVEPIAELSKSAKITHLTVRLLSQYTGRGPNRSRTVLNDDIVTVVLEGTLTKGELTLVRNGHGEVVHTTRKTFQDVMAAELISGVERILGRTVVAFLSDINVDPDIAIKTFILAPADR